MYKFVPSNMLAFSKSVSGLGSRDSTESRRECAPKSQKNFWKYHSHNASELPEMASGDRGSCSFYPTH